MCLQSKLKLYSSAKTKLERFDSGLCVNGEWEIWYVLRVYFISTTFITCCQKVKEDDNVEWLADKLVFFLNMSWATWHI